MDIVQFHQLTDQLFNQVETTLDNHIETYDSDIDYEIHGNVLTITFENKSKIIINTQEPLFEIWMATRKQGYHFDYQAADWICNRSGRRFDEILNEAIADQA